MNVRKQEPGVTEADVAAVVVNAQRTRYNRMKVLMNQARCLASLQANDSLLTKAIARYI
jgi:hypothetical protein